MPHSRLRPWQLPLEVFTNAWFKFLVFQFEFISSQSFVLETVESCSPWWSKSHWHWKAINSSTLPLPLQRGLQLLVRPFSLGTTLSTSLLTRSHWVILLKNIRLQLSQSDPVPLEPRHIEGSWVTLQESAKAGIINGTDSAGRSLFWPAQLFFFSENLPNPFPPQPPRFLLLLEGGLSGYSGPLLLEGMPSAGAE